MYDFSAKKNCKWILLIFLIGACSSSSTSSHGDQNFNTEQVATDASEVQELSDELSEGAKAKEGLEVPVSEGGLDPDEIEVVLKDSDPDPALVGLLRFFSELDKGIVVSDIDWSSPLSRDNPGVDCQLRHIGKGVFQCVVAHKKSKVVLRVEEKTVQGSKSQRQLNRITLDSVSSDFGSRMRRDLGALGFRFIETLDREKTRIDRFSSPTGETRADIVTMKNKAVVTLVLKSLGPARVRDRRSLPKSLGVESKKGATKAKN